MNNIGILSVYEFFNSLGYFFYIESRNRRKLRKNAKVHITVSFLISTAPGNYIGQYNTVEPFLYTFSMKVKEASTRKSSEDLITKFWDDFYKYIDIN